MSQKNVLGIVLLLIIIGMATRFLFLVPGYPHLPNFTAMGAVALFAAFHLKGWKAFVLPIMILWLSDIMLNNLVYAEYFSSFSLFGDVWVYLAFAAVIAIGIVLLRKLSIGSIIGASLIGGLVFYLITNFAVWIGTPAYPKTLAGLLECYTLALPFFRNTIAGNLFYCLALFGAYDLIVERRITFWPSLSHA